MAELQPIDVVLLHSASRTTSQNNTAGVGDTLNPGYTGIRVILDMTVVTASPSVTLTIQGKDPASGKYYTLLAGAAVTTATTNVYTVAPNAPVTTNVSANAELPETFRINIVANNANAGTYSVGYTLLP